MANQKSMQDATYLKWPNAVLMGQAKNIDTFLSCWGIRWEEKWQLQMAAMAITSPNRKAHCSGYCTVDYKPSHTRILEALKKPFTGTE